MNYLQRYQRKPMFQGGGEMGPPPPAAGPQGPPPGPGPEAGGGGGGGEEQLIALAEATMAGDMEAAAQLGQALAPMILQEVGGGGGGAPAGPAPGEQPVFRKGGAFLGKQ